MPTGTPEEQMIDGVLTFSEITEGVKVTVQSYFLDSQSSADENKFFWAYRILIENESAAPVRLIDRHWIITDGQGNIEEVKGEGVIGEQPLIQPTSSFIYTSGCPLGTPSGFMRGTYGMEDASGEVFTVTIPAFSLDSPFGIQHIN